MKKRILASLVCSIALMIAVPIHAEPVSNESIQREASTSDKGWLKKAEFMEKYRDEWSQINNLQKEKLELRIQMIDQREQLANMMLDAKKNGEFTKLKPAAEYHQQMKSTYKEKKELREQYKQQRKLMTEAVKTGNDQQMKQATKKCIELKKQENNLYKEKINMTNQLIKQLS